jgi:hypothetical protein
MCVARQDLPRSAAHPFYATVTIDATTLEATAALRSIVRHDTGESSRERCYHSHLPRIIYG